MNKTGTRVTLKSPPWRPPPWLSPELPFSSCSDSVFLCSSYILEKAMASQSSTLAWKIPWTEEPGRLQSMGLLRVGHDWATSLSLSCTGEGNGNPLQCSCLENPRDGGAWWAAIYGVTQSRTRLKWLNSSSSSSYISFLPCSSWMHKAYFASGPWYVIVVLPKRPHLLSSYFVFNFKVPA